MYKTIGEVTPAQGLHGLKAFPVCVGRRETPATYYVSEVKVCIVLYVTIVLTYRRRGIHWCVCTYVHTKLHRLHDQLY